jgi:hypothetical protein
MTTTSFDHPLSRQTTAAGPRVPAHGQAATRSRVSTQQPVRRRSSTEGASATKARLFPVAVVVVVVAVLVSLVGLVVTSPGQAEATTVPASAAVFGVVGMFSAVAGGLLAVIAAVRSQS